MSAVVYARLRATDPARWRSAAADWSVCAGLAEQWAGRLRALAARVKTVWSGTAARAAAARLDRLRRTALALQVLCRGVQRALTEFATALGRAGERLTHGRLLAAEAGLNVDIAGTVIVPAMPVAGAPLWSAFRTAGLRHAATRAAAEISAALSTAAEADEITTRRLTRAGW